MIADFYELLVCRYVLASDKEAFTVAPGLTHVRVVSLRNPGTDAYGKARIEGLLGARFARAALAGVQWATAATSSGFAYEFINSGDVHDDRAPLTSASNHHQQREMS